MRPFFVWGWSASVCSETPLNAPTSEPEAEDAIQGAPAVTQKRDVWPIGNHRLMCGDSTNPDHVKQLMGGRKARLRFTSLPYGNQRDYPANGITDWDTWLEFMRIDGWRRFGLYVWDQGPGMPGDWASRLAPAFELIFQFNKKRKPNKTCPAK